MTEPTKRNRDYLDGDEYFDSPLDEHNCRYKKSKEVKFTGGTYVYPCYVYDKNGKLIRIEHPKGQEIKGAKWVGRY